MWYGSLVLLLGLALPAGEPEPAAKQLSKDEIARAEKAVKDHLAERKGAHAQVKQITEKYVGKAAPGVAFYSVLFRQFPVAVSRPAGLKASTVFAVGRDGKVTVLDSGDTLAKFAGKHFAPVTDDAGAKDAVRAFLRLHEQFLQDGFYRFVIQEDAIVLAKEKGMQLVAGRTVVMAGGNGQLAVRMAFTPAGKLSAWHGKGEVRAGPRPRCQATKLLDADPIVRGMAEDALLGMGRAAKPYLDEQRARASPELKKAIDAIWQRIRARD